MGTTLNIEPLDATFGAVVCDIDLRSLDESTFGAVYEAWLEYALLLFPGANISPDEQNTFAKRFGEIEFLATPISNLGKDGKPKSDPQADQVKSLRGNEGWHHDSTYMPAQAKGAVFSAEIIPTEGAATGWADMRAAYEALDGETRELVAGLSASHSLLYSQGRTGYLPRKNDEGKYGMYGYHVEPVPLRPLVKVHPETGRPNLLIGRHAHDIVGMDPAQSEALLDKLNDEACQAPRTYHHQWEVGDAVIWDNRRLMHRGTPFDMTQPRRMWHTRIAGEPVSELAVNHLHELEATT
ncbi:MAG: TauD/TfdA dioxygenase family protein [Acidimicrobiales bacterium]